MTVCVVVELSHQEINQQSYSAIHAASQLSDNAIEVVVVGNVSQDQLDRVSCAEQVGQVHYKQTLLPVTAELIVDALKDKAHDYSHILAASSTFSKDWLPRLAGVLNLYAVTDIVEILDASHFVRPIYAGNAFEHLELEQSLIPMTIRPTLFDQQAIGSTPANIVQTNFGDKRAHWSEITSVAQDESDRPDLTSASVVVSGGRGVGSTEGFTQIHQLADCLGAAVGASRAAVDAEFVPNDYQVGQTGKIVAPDLYIAIGISGAVQHLAGMKDSKTIMAINSDEDAPIFKVADFGLVGDLHQIVPALIKLLKS